MTPDEADRLKARLADARATVEEHIPEWRDGAVAGTAPPDGTVADAAVIAPTALDAACDELSPQGAGWWHASTADVVRAALEDLTGHGMTVEDAADLLGSVIGAVQNEYGD